MRSFSADPRRRLQAEPCTSGQPQCRSAGDHSGHDAEQSLWFRPQAVQQAAQAIMLGDAKSSLPVVRVHEPIRIFCPTHENGQRMGNWELVDTMIKDGLWDAFNDYHMGITAENIATEYQISQQEQDEFAVASQQKAEAAKKTASLMKKLCR